MNREQALHNFWSGFGLTAYDENTVPDNAKLPYLTYNVATDDAGESVPLSASLWYHSTKWDDITAKKDEIEAFIGRGGVMLPIDGGAAWLKKSRPFAQRMSEPSDDMIRRIVLQVSIEFII